MRPYPHKPDEENVGENLAASLEQIETLSERLKAGKIKLNPRFFQVMTEQYAAAACESYALEKPMADVQTYLRLAALSISTSLDLQPEMDAVEFVDMQTIAVVAGDAAAASKLAKLTRKQYTTDEVECSEIHFLLAEMFSDLILGRDKELASRLAAAQKQLGMKKVSKEEHLWADSTVALAAAIAAGQQSGVDAALAAREKDWVKTYRAPNDRDEPDSLLDLTALALLRFAAQKDLHYNGTSVYVQKELIVRRNGTLSEN